ncbi:hypothetical protein P12x_005591 [Tundrisphaera lichenicola]|uniref:hypothetical protein n=1 Tax=Tundrisphaera lichenicola TaxID=2029860 RepID=UPI003EBA0255
MIRRDWLRALMATPPYTWLRPSFGQATISEPNAAVVYRKVFGWGGSLSEEDWDRLRKAATINVDDRAIEDLIRKARPILEAIREAATIEHCDWGIETVSPDDIGKGHLDPSNINVIRLAYLSSRRLARLGRGREALDDIFAGLKMAHRIGAGGVLIARILECGGEVPAFQTLGRILPELDRATLDDISGRLEALPLPEPASAVVGPESRFILGSLRANLATVGPKLVDKDWSEIGFDLETEKDKVATLKRLTGGDREKLLAHLDATGPAFAELARRLDLPRPGCRASLDEFARTERSTWPIVAGLVENVWGTRHMFDRMRALRAMLQAGLVLIRDGEPAFRRERDPFGTGGFGLERGGTGYLIRSAMSDEGKPEVSLGIGKAG